MVVSPPSHKLWRYEDSAEAEALTAAEVERLVTEAYLCVWHRPAWLSRATGTRPACVASTSRCPCMGWQALPFQTKTSMVMVIVILIVI